MSDRIEALLETLRARFRPDAPTRDLAEFLAGEGVEGRQIAEIVRRFRAGAPGAAGATEAAAGAATPAARPGATERQPPVRVLGPHEWGRFTPEAWGRLLALNGTGALSTGEFERLIERALEMGEGRVDLPGLRALLDGIGLGDAEADPTTTIH